MNFEIEYLQSKEAENLEWLPLDVSLSSDTN